MRKLGIVAVIALFSLLSSGCGGGAATNTSGTGPAPQQTSFDSPTYTVQPGQEVRYLCFTTRMPADQETIITQITPIYGKATHHLGIYYTLADEPDGQFDCPQLTKETWIPLYGGGVDSGTLKLPEGAGFHLLKGQQVLVQLHLLNAATTVVQDKATIVFDTTNDTTVTPAGIFGMSDEVISIPAQSNGVQESMDCAAGAAMNVFAVFGHMHQYGKQIALSRGSEMLYQAPWDFNNQPTVPMTFQVAPSDMLHLACSWDNPSSTAISYGESSTQEMCAFVLYYTPYLSLNGCQKTP